MNLPDLRRRVRSIDEVRIGGKKARLMGYSVYDRRNGLGGPVSTEWEIWIEGEGTVASGTGIRERDSSDAMHEAVKRLRKERRKVPG